MKIIHFTVKEPQFCGSFSFLAWEQRKLNELVTYHSSNLTASDSSHIGNYDLYDANQIIGKTNVEPMKTEYITIIKDGAGVGRIRIMPKNTMFIGTMGGLQANKSNIQFIFSLLTRFDLGKEFSGSTIPHIYFKDYGNNNYYVPFTEEQHAIGEFFTKIDNLITLHQCKDLRFLGSPKYKLSFEICDQKTTTWEQRELWSLTTWDKKFNEVEKEKQQKVIKYPYVLAEVFSAIEDNSGNVFLLSTGTYSGYTTEEKAGENLCEGEIVAIPWGGSPNVKYFCGKFVTADNRIATSNDKSILDNKYLYYWMSSQLDYLESIYRGASIKHPSMNDVLSMIITLPNLEEQKKIATYLSKIDNLITLHQCVLIKFKEHYYDKRNKQKRITYRLF